MVSFKSYSALNGIKLLLHIKNYIAVIKQNDFFFFFFLPRQIFIILKSLRKNFLSPAEPTGCIPSPFSRLYISKNSSPLGTGRDSDFMMTTTYGF